MFTTAAIRLLGPHLIIELLLKIEQLVMCLATMAYVCTVHVTIFITGGKFQLVSNFTEFHALTLAVHCYALLTQRECF